ncbi:molecular chaperone DnaJ [Marinimicrococcus flavescens]|uniref:Chaperone protein DnaJ n=1 Tax=Marinimicrococcus flavescens TaxID=3031815 RepID=A0AAP3XQL9_9PROT|nr:molecular chaperone DnaJ [Marinimicrococcus flavescens]
MAKRDYYETLGVARTATEADLKRAYRQMALKYHPDRNPGDAAAEAKFKEANEAYEVLKDPQKRAAYDQFGHQAFEAGMGGGRGGQAGFDFSSFADVFDDLFGDFMGGGGGGGRRRGGSPRGADLRYNLAITLEEAFAGKKAQIRVPTSVTCEGCHGSGSESGSEPVTCPTCRGAGRVRAQQGFFTVERTCPTCQGTGRTITNPCKGCSGSGRVEREKTLAVTIPAGVEDGTRIRLSGEGEAGIRGGQPGDLYIFVSVAPHRLFKRDGMHLFCRVPIPMTKAALGGQIEVPTIEGKRLRVAVPEGTQTGRQIRLKGKGMTELQGQARGDMFVELVVETPVKLTKRQQELLREFEKAGDGSNSHQPESEGFFARVKELWDELRD